MDSQNSETLLISITKLCCCLKGTFSIAENWADLPLVSNPGNGAPGCLAELQHNQITDSACDSRGIFLPERNNPLFPFQLATELQTSLSQVPSPRGLQKKMALAVATDFPVTLQLWLTTDNVLINDPCTNVKGAVLNSSFCCPAEARAQITLAQHSPYFPLVSMLSCMATALGTLKVPTVYST